jgi:hypothetical protein
MGLKVMAYGSVDWIHVASDRNMWQALVVKVTNTRIPEKGRGICLPAKRILSSQKAFCSVELECTM